MADRRPEQYEDDSALAVCVLASVLEVGAEAALKLRMDSLGEKRLPRVFAVLAEYLEPKPDWPKEGHRDLWDITVTGGRLLPTFADFCRLLPTFADFWVF